MTIDHIASKVTETVERVKNARPSTWVASISLLAAAGSVLAAYITSDYQIAERKSRIERTAAESISGSECPLYGLSGFPNTKGGCDYFPPEFWDQSAK